MDSNRRFNATTNSPSRVPTSEEGAELVALEGPSSAPLLSPRSAEAANNNRAPDGSNRRGSIFSRAVQNRTDAARTRRNAAALLIMALSSTTNGFMSAVYGMQLIAIGAILPTNFTPACEQPMQWWLVVYGVRLLMIIPLTLYKTVNYKVPLERTPREATIFQLIDTCVRLLDLFYYAWFIVGNIWLFSDPHCKETNNALYTLSLVFMIIGYLFLALPCLLCGMIVCCLPCIVYMIGYIAENSPGSGASAGASQDTIQEHCVVVKYHTGQVQNDECVICLVDFEEGEELRQLPCNHTFHSPCVDKWLKINKSCPLCKAPIDVTRRPTDPDLSSIHLHDDV